ncbi:MAG: TIGR02680 family protein, partial [Pseudomonas sp.]|nr:TIGR02680 family protein [Pseudomonas sp.]
MTDALFTPPPPRRPTLPEPQRERWQPLRLGLVELFHYDSEEFWFRDGHLLLRGNNGTGKSKVLSLTLPFLFDAQLRPSRIEPDGDNGKKMAWNLLMSSYQRRIGYTWIEFGRRTTDGVSHYITLGAGLSAAVGKTQVDSWFFILEGGPNGADARIGQDIWLTNEQKMVLTRERLREAVEGQGRGKLFENAHSYRRAVDERLFQIGTKRYEALMDTLIQLRQPQLSKKPDEAGLSHALTEALPPMPIELLSDVAEALNQLEEDRIQLEDIRSLERAIKHFEQRYRTYAGTVTRRQTRELRQAQTGFDKASEGRNKAHADLKDAQEAEDLAKTDHAETKQLLAAARTRLQTLQSDPANQDANRLSQAETDAKERKVEAEAAEALRNQAQKNLNREEERSRQSNQRSTAAKSELLTARAHCAEAGETAGTGSALSDNLLVTAAPEELPQLAPSEIARAATLLRDATSKRREDIRHLESRHTAVNVKQQALVNQQTSQRDRQAELEEAAERRAEADLGTETAGNELIDAWHAHCSNLAHLHIDQVSPLEQLVDWVARPEGDNPIHVALTEAYRQSTQRHASLHSALTTQQNTLQSEQETLSTERDRLLAGHDAVPTPPAMRAAGIRDGRPGAPLWRLVDFQSELDAKQRAGLEAALEASGLLDAWLSPDGSLTDANGVQLLDSAWARRPPVLGRNLANALHPDVPDDSAVTSALVASLLAAVAYGSEDHGQSESWVSEQGGYRLGALAGAWQKPQAVYIGHTARANARQRRLSEIADRLGEIDILLEELQKKFQRLVRDGQEAEREWKSAPSDQLLRAAMLAAASAEREVLQARQRLDAADAQCRAAEAELQVAREALERDAADLQLPSELADLTPINGALDRFVDAHQQLALAGREWCSAWPEYQTQQEREKEAMEALSERAASLLTASERAAESAARYEVLKGMIGAKVDTLRQQLRDASAEVSIADGAWEAARSVLTEASERRAVAASQADSADAVLA